MKAAVLHTRALLALTFALARYVPIPILDDVLRERIGRMVVARAATSRDVTLDPQEIVVLGASSEGCLGCLFVALWLPIRLLLTPIWALLGVLLGLRWASRDLIEMFALGRTIERLIDDGRYPASSPIETRVAYARDARRAFDRARRGLDTRAVQGLLSAALGPLRSILPAAMRSMRRLWHGETPTPSPAVEAPTSRLMAALEDPRMKELLEAIDRRFDDALLEQRARSADAP